MYTIHPSEASRRTNERMSGGGPWVEVDAGASDGDGDGDDGDEQPRLSSSSSSSSSSLPFLFSEEQLLRRENRGGIWALADDMRESSTVLTRAAAADWGARADETGDEKRNATNTSSSSSSSSSFSPPGSSSSAAASVAFSCFRWGGYITRSVTSRGALSMPFEAGSSTRRTTSPALDLRREAA